MADQTSTTVLDYPYLPGPFIGPPYQISDIQAVAETGAVPHAVVTPAVVWSVVGIALLLLLVAVGWIGRRRRGGHI